jgi:hypothetical protein
MQGQTRGVRTVLAALLAATAITQGVDAQGASPPAPSSPGSNGPAPTAAMGGEVCAKFQDPAAGAANGGAAAVQPGYDCRLPAWDASLAWPFAGTLDAAEAFHWSDATGESIDPQGEITGVGWVPVHLTKADARSLLKAGAFLTSGAKANKAIKAGDYLLIQIETAETPAIAADRNLSFHLGTDRRNDPGNNTPSSVTDPLSPYQDLQDVYTLYLAAGRKAGSLYSTDFAAPPLSNGSAWYNGNTAFAARLTTSPAGVQFLLPAKAVGDTFRPISSSDRKPDAVRGVQLAAVDGSDVPILDSYDQGTVAPTGADFGAIGTRLGLLPKHGIANALVGCLEADLVHQPLVLDSLNIAGKVEENAEMLSQTPVIWCTWPTFADGDALATWFNFADADGDGATIVSVTVTVVERYIDKTTGKDTRQEQRQTSQARITLRGGNVYVGLVVGLRHFGYHHIESIELGSTLNAEADRILGKSAAAAAAIMPPWSVGPDEGVTAGDSSCIPPDAREAVGAGPR